VEDTYELHLPGHNYIGPGTHVIHRVLDKIPPIDHDDALALIHDIEYLAYGGVPTAINHIDDHAINNARYTPGGMAMKIGLLFRKTFDLDLAQAGQNDVGFMLKQYVSTDPYWQAVLNKYQVTWTPNPLDNPDLDITALSV
jgi:hypothetical protein